MPTSPAKQILPSKLEKTHIPRARRLSLQTSARYRAKGLGIWRAGIVKNLSQSGVLFHGPVQVPQYALVEMVFEMPEEISGQKLHTVLCQAGFSVMRKCAAAKSSAWPCLSSTTHFFHQD